eukprot:TRINITY_DN4274_c0_g1_i6.p1 TRINITY_DN4274_c0_g1~~TRINITY_DN4274_c0_g1_i6.p1  ORF type:complete len:807 (+),score=169.26 TRINITY_DN4274_c0_g1_i6:202-2622(+)
MSEDEHSSLLSHERANGHDPSNRVEVPAAGVVLISSSNYGSVRSEPVLAEEQDMYDYPPPSQEYHRDGQDKGKGRDRRPSIVKAILQPKAIHIENSPGNQAPALGQASASSSQIVPLEDVELEYTYWLMKKRQWSRLQRGTFRNKTEPFSLLWFLFFALFYGAYLVLQVYQFQRNKGYILEFILMGFVSLTLGLLISRLGWFVRCVCFEIYVALFVFFVEDLYYMPNFYIPLASGLFLTIVFTIICFFIYPYLLRCYLSCTGSITMKIDKDSWRTTGINRFVVKQRGIMGGNLQCVYEGPIRNGRPNGIGTWMDTSYQGELLTGYWEDGVPIGPFESMENDTRSMLVNLRITFGTNGGGRWWLDRTPLNVGVAGVECCVSGNFFKGYPKVQMLTGPTECTCRNSNSCSCVDEIMRNRHYRHIEEEKTLKSVVVSIDKKHDSLVVSGHKSRRSKQKSVTIEVVKTARDSVVLMNSTEASGSTSSSSGQEGEASSSSTVYSRGMEQRLQLDSQWLSSELTEGLLFIHGYDHNLKDSLKRFGQFLALGHFPSHLRPFVFNWPSSTNPFLYWCAHSVASDNDTHRDLKRFLQSLRMSGIRQLHVLCHSMGTRFFLRSFPIIKKVFAKRFVDVLSPNTSFNEGHIPEDNPSHMDGLRRSTSYLESPMKEDERKIHMVNLILLNPDYEIETFRNDHSELRSYCSRITVYADHRDQAIRLAFKMTQKASMGNNILPILDNKGSFLDMDIIDTGDLDSNMSERHHSFFNVNRLMVDDLWDLVVTGKRAEERTSRLKNTGRVYRFTILPSSVVMV